MYAWITSFWKSYDPISGPARNAPNNGVHIKQIMEQKPKEIEASSNITETQLQLKISKLKKIPPPTNKKCYKSPIMTEFDNIFSMGTKAYLDKIKNNRKRLNYITAIAAPTEGRNCKLSNGI